jgi:hypothetical protein
MPNGSAWACLRMFNRFACPHKALKASGAAQPSWGGLLACPSSEYEQWQASSLPHDASSRLLRGRPGQNGEEADPFPDALMQSHGYCARPRRKVGPARRDPLGKRLAFANKQRISPAIPATTARHAACARIKISGNPEISYARFASGRAYSGGMTHASPGSPR